MELFVLIPLLSSLAINGEPIPASASAVVFASKADCESALRSFKTALPTTQDGTCIRAFIDGKVFDALAGKRP